MADDAATETSAVSEEPEAQPQEAQEEQVESAEQEAEQTDGEQPESGEESAEDPERKKSSIQDRFSQLTQQRKEAEARAQEAEQRVRDAEERLKFYESQYQQEQEEDPFPRLEDVEYDESAYQSKVAEWYQRQNARSAQQAFMEQQRTASELERQQAQKAARDVFKARADAFAAQYPDFYQTISNPSLQVNQTVARAALVSEHGPALAYHIAKNPDVAARLSSMSPELALMEIGRIEQKLTSPVAQKPSNAPPPAKPVGSRAAVQKDPDKMTPEEYVAYRQKQQRA